MPHARISFVRQTSLILAVGVAALLAIVAVSIWLAVRTETYFDDVLRARTLRSASADLLSLMQDVETGQRGYLLTNDESYLAPYRAAVDRIRTPRGALEQALAFETGAGLDLDRQVASVLGRLDEIVAAKLAEIDRTIELTRDGDRAGALAVVQQGDGRRLMDEARVLLGATLDRSERLLQLGATAQQRSVAQLRWVTIAGAAVILLMVFGAGYTILGYVGHLAAARAEVEALNIGLEARVEERTIDLMRANEEIQRFAYIVTHDLRAPLVNIMGFTTELEATVKPIAAYLEAERGAAEGLRTEALRAVNEDLPEALGFIRTSTRKMDGLINAILKISREGRRVLTPEAVDLKAALQASAASVHHQAALDGGEISIVGPPVPVITDRLSIEQILGNLFDNAIKCRAGGRAVRIVGRAARLSPARVMIEIEDNGRGIAPQDHERVFELFRRSGTQDRPGEGIGLAHVRTLVRNLGGDITLQSEPGRGTTFRIVLPADLTTVRRSVA